MCCTFIQNVWKFAGLKAWSEAHIEGLHGNVRHFVVDSLHNGSQAVLWSEMKRKVPVWGVLFNKKLRVLTEEMFFWASFDFLQNVSTRGFLKTTETLKCFLLRNFPTYPLVVVPILSQMSIMSPQSSVVLFSFVAFSGNVSKEIQHIWSSEKRSLLPSRLQISCVCGQTCQPLWIMHKLYN